MPRVRFPWWVLLITLPLAGGVSVPLGVVVHRAWTRATITQQLGSTDPQQRERALSQLVQRAVRDKALARAAVKRVESLPGDAAAQAARALELAGYGDVPALRAAVRDAALAAPDDETFLDLARWLARDARPLDAALIDDAIRRYADAPAAPGGTASASAKNDLFQVIDKQGRWTSPPVPFSLYLERLLRLGEASEPAVRLALSRRLADLPIDHPRLDVAQVAEAVRRLLSDEEPAVRFRTLYTAANLLPLDPSGTMRELLVAGQDDVDPRNAVLASRLLVAWRVWGELSGDAPPTPPPREPANGGPAHRGLEVPPLPPWPPPDEHPGEGYWTALLRALEAAPQASMDLTFDERLPHLLRPAFVLAAQQPTTDWLYDTFCVDHPPALRDLACVVAAERFGTDALETLINALRVDLDPDARRSAAILSGLTGLRWQRLYPDAEPRPEVARVMDLGLWMQDRASLSVNVETSAWWPEVPLSTAVLAHLHRGLLREGLDALLGPERLSNEQLAELLGRQRWALVLRRYLPLDAPPLDLWADAAAFSAQLEGLRAWHAVRRYTYPRGGLP